MRIFYDHQATSLQDAGGVSRYHFELAKALRSAPGTEIDYYLGLNASVLPFEELRNERTRVVSHRTTLRPGYLRYGINSAGTVLHALQASRFDIYHSTYQRFEPAIRHRCLVATHHDSIQERFPHLFRDARAIQNRKRRLYAQADVVICVSEASRADLEHFYGVEEDRTAVIHHGFRKLDEADAAASPGEPIPSRAPYLLYVGSRWEYKNFASLLDAFGEILATNAAPHHLALIAAGGGPWTRAEEEKIARLRLQENVTLLPRVQESALASLYRSAALFVYPSLCEGFGFPPLEAMSEGCPALVSRTSSMPEICGDAAFYFEPGVKEHLTQSIVRLLNDSELRNSKREAGFKQVERYTWPAAAAATLAVYEGALERIGFQANSAKG